MKPVYLDVHIHTSHSPTMLNTQYDINKLKAKVEGIAQGHEYLISLTDHNTINKAAYLTAMTLIKNLLIGVEIHIRNHSDADPYHCHILFKDEVNALNIDNLNAILDKLYPTKEVQSEDASIPGIEDIMNSFDEHEFILLPHGGQNHSTFDESISDGKKFDHTLERSIYFNYFDGFTARSRRGLERTVNYLKRLGIHEFVNLVTCTDNYDPKKYPMSKEATASEFTPTWMLASPTFEGLRLSLSESSRLEYGVIPDSWSEHIRSAYLKNDHIDLDINLTQGLNVVIGGSSSGKSLLVDSIYSSIIKDFSSSVYANTQYDAKSISVDNPAGLRPHYFDQNYISRICDIRDSESSIENIDILKNVFPSDDKERRQINKCLGELNRLVNQLFDAVKEIEKLHTELARIPALSHLLITTEFKGNPIAPLLPDENTERHQYAEDQFTYNIEYLDEIESFLAENPFVKHDKTLVQRIKKELGQAFYGSQLEGNAYDIIKKGVNEIDSVHTSKNKETTSKEKEFRKLLSCVERYKKYDQQFAHSLEAISKYSVAFTTTEIASHGNKLFIDNQFKLSKEEFLHKLNKHLKQEHQIDNYDMVTPELLFSTKVSKRSPKVHDLDDFAKKMNAEFAGMNNKKYRIVTSEGKDFEELSAGWKTSVILDLIFGWGDDAAPLIIDQPEDNLATGYINKGLVEAIKRCKPKRQIILVSHNATIPMLGDAQNVIMCTNEGGYIKIRSNLLESEIDGKGVVDLIAETTDGGKSSVKKRVKKYNLKRFQEDS